MIKLKICITCKYFSSRSGVSTCHEPTNNFPNVREIDFCSKWKPNRLEKETIIKAWKEFQLIVKLTENGEEND